MIDKKGLPNYHEVILGTNPFRMYFDIDCEDINDKTITKVKLISDFVNACGDYLREKQNINYPKNRFSILSSHSEKKYSFHIILPDVLVPDVETMKFVSNEIKLRMKYGKYLDCSYHQNKNFRLPFNSKFGKNNPMKFEEEWIYNDNIKDQSIEFKYECDLKVPVMMRIFESSIINSMCIKYILPAHTQTVKSTESIEITQEKRDEISSQIVDLCVDGTIPAGLELDVNYNNIFILKNTKSGFECPICKRTHERENAYVLYLWKGIYFKCFRSNPKDSILLKAFIINPPNNHIMTYS
jgi:hypothetical protein